MGCASRAFDGARDAFDGARDAFDRAGNVRATRSSPSRDVAMARDDARDGVHNPTRRNDGAGAGLIVPTSRDQVGRGGARRRRGDVGGAATARRRRCAKRCCVVSCRIY